LPSAPAPPCYRERPVPPRGALCFGGNDPVALAARYCAAVAQGNVEIVRSLYRAIDAHDVVAVAELTHPDSEWISDSRKPIAATYHRLTVAVG
jgi:hypothetical protein